MLTCNTTPSPQPDGTPVCTLAANPSTFTVGQAVTLTASCTQNPTNYVWTNTVATGNVATVQPLTTTTYSVQASNGSGAGNTASVTVSLQSATPQCILSASPASIVAGASSSLSVSCSPSASSLAWTNAPFGSFTSSGTVSPNQTTTYSVIGSNAAGAGNSSSATVNVSGGDAGFPPTSCANNGNPLTALSGDLDWNIGGGNATYSEVMGKGQAYVYRMTTGASAALAQLDLVEYIGQIVNRTVVISEKPCDFDVSKVGNASGFGLRVGVYFSVGQANNLSYPQLKANTTYYINVKNAAFSAPNVDTCLDGWDCRFIMFLRH